MATLYSMTLKTGFADVFMVPDKCKIMKAAADPNDWSEMNLSMYYCTISIDSSDREYLTCRNMGVVTGHGGVLCR